MNAAMTPPGDAARLDPPSGIQAASSTGSPADKSGAVSLRAAVDGRIDLGRVPAAFGDEMPNWLGQPIEPASTHMLGYLCDLELRVSPGRLVTFRKSAIISLGAPVPMAEGWLIPIEWRAATLAPLFPVLVGQLIVTADRVAIEGHYAPPFGTIGYVLDRGLLSIAARGTARWFLTKVAGILAA